MVKELNTSETVRILLDGGYIAEKCPNTGKIRKYTVHKKNDIWGIAPHITPKQFEELISAGVIRPTKKSKTNKYGDIYNFYEIEKKEN